MPTPRRPRTRLEERIRALPMTLEEFVQHAETYARGHDLDGTLSLRHLQRLITGDRPTVRPATARLLEALLGQTIDELLAPPAAHALGVRSTRCSRLTKPVDDEVVEALRLQLTALRSLDRRLGAGAVSSEVEYKIHQVDDFANTVTLPRHRRAMLRLLTELHTLAGWLALDQMDLGAAWRHHNRALDAARGADSHAHVLHARAQQAVVLAESGRLDVALDQAESAWKHSTGSVSGLMSAWLGATYGELLGRAGDYAAASRAFDGAQRLVHSPPAPGEPYTGLDESHLHRWRIEGLAPGCQPDAIVYALDLHDRSFRRGEAFLRIDLALALRASDRRAAHQELTGAADIAAQVSSPRLRARVRTARSVLHAEAT